MTRIVLALLLCCLGLTAAADETSHTIAEERADAAHNPDAEAALAARYLDGNGVPQDVTEGLRLMEHAAKRGSAEAESGLAQLYERGRPGVAPDSEKAARYLRSAAQHGSAHAQGLISYHYFYGTKPFEKDPLKAVAFAQAAADQGDETGSFLMGLFYRGGIGNLPQNAKAAAIYFHFAAPKYPRAYYALGTLYDTGDGVPRDPVRAERFFRKAADANDAEGRYNLGDYYWKGLGGLAVDHAVALKYWRLAADQDNFDALDRLAMISLSGADGEPKDIKAALAYLRRSADKGGARAQFFLASILRQGDDVAKDCESSLRYLQLSADSGSTRAQNELGEVYQQGDCAPKDPAKAIGYFTRAADQGEVRAFANLGHAYEDGIGVEKDVKIALSYYQQAAAQNNARVLNHIGLIYFHGREGVAAEPERAVVAGCEKVRINGAKECVRMIPNRIMLVSRFRCAARAHLACGRPPERTRKVPGAFSGDAEVSLAACHAQHQKA